MANSADVQQQPVWLDQVLKASQEDFARRLAEVVERRSDKPASPPAGRAQGLGAFAEMAWKDAIDRALDVLNVKYAELSPADRAASAGLALAQVAVELRSAKKRYGTYSAPDHLDRRKRYVSRAMSTKSSAPTTIREAILAILPSPGASERVETIKKKLTAGGMASSESSVLNEIRRMRLAGVLEVQSQRGGRLIVRSKSKC